jgi:hypothetical protein
MEAECLFETFVYSDNITGWCHDQQEQNIAYILVYSVLIFVSLLYV